ncbi:uncharacterized protein [Rutidosis leptorrhynchoides]|uniref:uncharacterized protein n=1 Tax=Rutidosis leptorrhynchoides TaxID=125765 RepID=UPI003A996408
MISNQCLNLFNHPTICLFTSISTPLKPYGFRPVVTYRNNCILIGTKSRRRTSSRNKLLIAQSSSDIVLIATTEHRDGSLVFRFGDVSELVEKVEEIEEIESGDEQESNVLNVLDGVRERQVTVKTIEVDDRIGNADIESDVAEGETNVVCDLRDDLAESSEKLADNSDQELIPLQSDANMNSYNSDQELIGVVKGTLDETERIVHHDGEEGTDPTISPFDDGQNRDRRADPEGILLEINEDETEDPPVTVMLESVQVSEVEFEDVKQSCTEDELEKVESEDINDEIDKEYLMPLAEVNDEEVLEGMNINEYVEKELEDLNVSMGTFIDEMLPSDTLDIEPTSDEVNMEVSSTKAVDFKVQAMEDELQQISTDSDELNGVTYLTESAVEENLSDPKSTPLELKPTMQVSDTELQDIMDCNLDDEILQVINVNEDPSVSVKLETTQASLTEVMDVTQPYVEDELHKVDPKDTIEGDTEDLLPPETMLIYVELVDTANEKMEEGLQDMKSSDDTLTDRIPPSDLLGPELTLDEVGQHQLSDVKLEATMEVLIKDQAVEDDLQNDYANVMPAEPFVEEEVSQAQLTPTEINPTMQLSNIELQDTVGQNLDDRPLKANDESEDPSVSVNLETMQASQVDIVDVTQPITSDVELTDDANEDIKEGLEDMNISGDILIDGMQLYDPLVDESTLDDVKDQAVSNEFQQVSTDNRDENVVENEVPPEPILEEELSRTQSTSVTMQVSDIEVEDATGQNLDDEILQVIDDEAGDSFINDVEQSPNQLEVQTVQVEGVNDMMDPYDETDALGSSILLTEGVHGLLLEGEITEGECSEHAEESEDTTLLAAESEVKGEEIDSIEDFLSSGAAFLEHPYKALTGGDDAYFLAGSKWLGVANGVGQWSFEGTDPGRYAKELMRTCEEIVLDTSAVPVTNTVELLCRGVSETNMSGSSNVLIANFDGQALHVANIGDTGFLIIRHGAIYKKSSPLLHDFHFALQVEDSDDPLLFVEEYKIELDEGDVVVSATDGLFDNLYEREIALIVSKSLQAGMKPEEIANVLATRAQDVGRSAFLRSPFSDAAQSAGYTGYSGGKPDNVAVIVSLVEKISNRPVTDSLISTS